LICVAAAAAALFACCLALRACRRRRPPPPPSAADIAESLLADSAAEAEAEEEAVAPSPPAALTPVGHYWNSPLATYLLAAGGKQKAGPAYEREAEQGENALPPRAEEVHWTA